MLLNLVLLIYKPSSPGVRGDPWKLIAGTSFRRRAGSWDSLNSSRGSGFGGCSLNVNDGARGKGDSPRAIASCVARRSASDGSRWSQGGVECNTWSRIPFGLFTVKYRKPFETSKRYWL